MKEEGRSDLSSNPKNLRFNKSSLTFNRYKHFNFNKSLFELGNIPLDRLLECINKITAILDKYVNDVSPFNTKLRKLFIHDLAQERDVIAENRLKIGKELVLKFNVDRLCESAIKYKLSGNESDLNKFNISAIPTELETDKNFLNTLDSKRTRSEKAKSTKQKPKSDGKRIKSGKKEDQIVEASNLNYYIKYFNYLKLYYQYYMNHFVSVYIFYKSYSNGSRNDAKRSWVHIRDGERTVYILGKLFVYFRKLAILHLKCLINLLPLSFVYNPDNFINYNGLVDYNDVIYCEMNSLGDLDSGLRLELKRNLFDCIEINRKFDLEEFNNFLNVNNLNDLTLESGKQFSTTIETGAAGDHDSRVDAFSHNAPFQNGFDPRIYTDSITNFAAAIHSGPLYPINPSLIPSLAKKSLNLLFDVNSNLNGSFPGNEKSLLDMLPSFLSEGNERNIVLANSSTDRADTKTCNRPPTASGATNSKDRYTHTSSDSGKDNWTNNNNHSIGRRSDGEHNDGKYDYKQDGRYDANHDPEYRDQHDNGYHDRRYVKREDGRNETTHGGIYNESKYDSNYGKGKYDIRNYTVKNDGRNFEDKHDVKHDRRYSYGSYEDSRHNDHIHADGRHDESRYSGDASRRGDDSSRSGSSSSRYSDTNRHSDKRRHSDGSKYGSSIRRSSGNGRYGGDRRYDSRHEGRYGHYRYRDGRHGGRRSISHSTHSSSSSSGSYHRSYRNRRPERHTHPVLTRSSSAGSSSSSHSMGRGLTSHVPQQNPPIKLELGHQNGPCNPPQSTTSTEGPLPSSRGVDARSLKMDSAEKERLGKELKSGKKLKSSTKFSTMNIKEIFNSLASKARPADATTSAHDSHLGYKSRGHSASTGLRDCCDSIGSDSGSPSSMVTDVTTSSNDTVDMAVDDMDDSAGGSMAVDADAYATSTSIVTASDPDANKGVDSSAGKHMGEGTGDNPGEITAGKTDDTPLTSMQSYIENIK
nr:hypothetical protein MACL_00000643 [Theileria orientalis]